MINLQELEKEIDILLDSETDESIREWLANNKANHVDCYVDAGGVGGTYQNMVVKDKIKEVIARCSKLKMDEDENYENNSIGSQNYGIAA
jgi:hypothetical protein